MPTNSARITLLAPGCFSELPDASAHSESESSPARAEEAVELNAATVRPTQTLCYEQALLACLGQPTPEPGQLPIAQLRFLVDANAKAPPHCVCAEFVHLHADTSNARLVPSAALALSHNDARQLRDSLNALIAEDGLELLQFGENLYLTGMPAQQLDTWPAHALATGKVANYLPRHTGAGDWRRLLTEVQMLFHAHPVNEVRVKNQQLPVNGIWFWGGAKLETPEVPEHPVQANTIQLIATDAFAVGLGSALNCPAMNPDSMIWECAQGEVVVVELGVYQAWLSGDKQALLEAKQHLQTQWILPAQQAIASGEYTEFVLDGCEGQVIVETQKVNNARNQFSSLQQWVAGLFAGKTAKKSVEKKS